MALSWPCGLLRWGVCFYFGNTKGFRRRLGCGADFSTRFFLLCLSCSSVGYLVSLNHAFGGPSPAGDYDMHSVLICEGHSQCRSCIFSLRSSSTKLGMRDCSCMWLYFGMWCSDLCATVEANLDDGAL